MLSQPHRLPASVNLKQSRYRKTPLFAVKFAKNDQKESRFGFVVRKTVDKRSVYRNRIKRVFRAGIEQHLTDIATGYDMLFFLEKGIIEKSSDEVWQKLHLLLKEEKLIQ